MSNNDKYWYLPTVKGEKVKVSEEVYKAYWNQERAEERKARRHSRCRNGKGVMCRDNCETCPYFRANGKTNGSDLSADMQKELSGQEIADVSPGPEEMLLKKELIRRLNEVLDTLDAADRLIVRVMEKEAEYRQVIAELDLTLEQFKYRKKQLKQYLFDALSDWV